MRGNRTNTPRKPLLAAFALAAGVSVLLTGCAGKVSLGASPTPTAADVTETPAPTPTPGPVVLPECDAMNAAAQQEYEDYGPENFSAPAGETDLSVFDQAAVKAARAAMGKAVQQRGCSWPVHMEGTVTEYAVELAEADRSRLIDALKGDDRVRPSTLGDAESFRYVVPADSPMANDTKVTYFFIGAVWVSIFDYAGQREYEQAALDGILAANPSLADADAGRDEDTDAGRDEDEASEAVEPQKCSTLSGPEALAKWGAGIPGGPWDLTGQFSDATGYDACAALSWIVLRPDPCCTRFSITPVLFFHNGEYVPDATATGYAMDSEKGVQRASDGELSVTYMWQGADIAGPANTATSAYRWDEKSGKITRTGDLPPS